MPGAYRMLMGQGRLPEACPQAAAAAHPFNSLHANGPGCPTLASEAGISFSASEKGWDSHLLSLSVFQRRKARLKTAQHAAQGACDRRVNAGSAREEIYSLLRRPGTQRSGALMFASSCRTGQPFTKSPDRLRSGPISPCSFQTAGFLKM